MSDSRSSLQKGIAIATNATAKDNAKEYEEAVKLYTQAVEYLLHACKYEVDKKAGEQVRDKIMSYLKRAEDLKKSIRHSKAKEPAGGVQAKKSNSNPESDKEDEESAEMKSSLVKSIVGKSVNVSWDDIIGLEIAKSSLREAAILPVKFPHLFTGQRKAWSGILLYGPPGTGKTYLAKAVATEAPNSTFFSISSSDLISKWQGESEKKVKELFMVAREKKPSIVFIDEVDSVCSSRSDNEAESTRRIKTEFMTQMQGVGRDNDGVLILAATNDPFGLDSAIRRRFQKRIYIPLPERPDRESMFKVNMTKVKHTLKPKDFAVLASKSEGYSGADVHNVVQDAIYAPVRKVQSATHFKKVSGPSPADPSLIVHDLLTPCSPGDSGAIEMSWQDVPGDKLLEPPVDMRDLLTSLATNKATVNQADLEKYEQFTRDFGQDGA